MRGTKRLAVPDSAPDTNDTALRNRKVMLGASFDVRRPEPTLPQSNAMPPLDLDRAESSRQHVRALNTQFASWVQTQLKNHPDELWEDGVRDYLAHASNIMEKFSDVVNWLKANAIKGVSASVPLTAEKKLVPELKGNDSKIFQEKSGMSPSGTSTSFTTSWSSSVFSGNQTSNSQSSSVLSNGYSSGLFSNSTNQSSGFSNSQSSGLFSFTNNNNQNAGLISSSNNQSSGLYTNSNNQSFGLLTNNQSSGLYSNSQGGGVFSSSQSSGGFPTNQISGVFSSSPAPILFGGQSPSSMTTNQNTSDDADEENELQQPGSPSVKKSDEEGILVVHEVKCKLYVKSADPADKDPWKDKGTGQLSIKCKEGVSKGTKESQPTIIVRNDVGKVLLNALLYPGIKTNTQKNSLVAIFHTAGDDGSDTPVARTFLIRLKTEDDRNKLAVAIQEHAPPL